jgi:hypothetical protein
VSLYKIDHLSLPANEDLCTTVERCRGDQRSQFSEWNVPVGPDVSFQAPRFHIEIAHTSIGIHNEHFLHHRRSGSYHLCCKLLGSARLNMEWNIRLAAIAAAPFRDDHSSTNGLACQLCMVKMIRTQHHC